MKVVVEKNEVWSKAIFRGEESDRYVSTLGRAAKANGEELLLADNGAGYLSISISNNRNTRAYIHRVVAETFIPNPDNLPQVNHIDCDKSNNCVDNLEWVSGSQNIKDAHKNGRMKKRTENGQIQVLTVEQVIDLYTAVKRDGVGISEKARQMNIPRTTASSILNKRSRSDITDRLDTEFSNGTTH